jgi:MFS family permease
MSSTPPSQQEIKKSLRYSLWDGAAWSVTVGFAELYFSPFAIFLGAANLMLGLLATLPQLVGALAQLATPFLVGKCRSRKNLVLAGVAGQSGMLLFFALSPFLGERRLIFLLLMAILYWIFWMITVPAWESWIGELVPERKRGEYFGKRNRLIQLVMFGALIAGGWVLDLFEGDSYPGFLLLILFGLLGRIGSLAFLSRQTEPRDTAGDGRGMSFFLFLKSIHRHNFGLFVLYIALFAAAMNVASPYFIQYMLEDLRFSYLEFMAAFAVMIGVKFLTIPLWGRLADRFGARKLLVPASLLLSLVPFLWLGGRSFFFITAIQIFAGLAIGGFELCSFNFLLDCTRPGERTRFAAYYQVLMGVGIVAGSVIGGLLLKYRFFTINIYLAVFVLSGLLRLLFSVFFLPRIREMREVEEISYRRLLTQAVRFQKSVAE